MKCHNGILLESNREFANELIESLI